MSNFKSIKIHEKVYNELKENLRFNESFSDYINRMFREREIVNKALRDILVKVREMSKKDL